MEMEEVPGSDEEEYLPLLDMPLGSPVPAMATLAESSIASFSVQAPSAKSQSNRPRPKPAYKGPANADSSMISSFPEIPSSLSERVKLRGRGASKNSTDPVASSSLSHRAVHSEIIEIDSSSEDELASYKESRKTALKENSRSKAESSLAASSFSFSHPPIPSRNRSPPNNFNDFSALPPSNPFPQSTSTGYYPELEEDDGSVPPIAALTTAADTSFEPNSSPTTKEGPRPKLVLNPPRPHPSSFRNGNQVLNDTAVSDDGLALMMPPPLPVDLPSTSIRPAHDIPSGSTISPSAQREKPPPKKPRKKQDADQGEKPAKKPRAKKAKKDAGAGDGAVEKPKKKGKGKEKEKDKDKQEFKSAEFIMDDDDEPVLPIDPVPPPPADMFADDAVLSKLPGNKPDSVVSIPDSQPDEESIPLVVGKRKRVAEEIDEEETYSGAAGNKAKPAGTQKNKKAKASGAASDKERTKKAPAKKARTVMSDEESAEHVSVPEDAIMPDAGDTGPVASETDEEVPQRKYKSAKKRQFKRVVAASDSEAEENHDANAQPPTTSRTGTENIQPDGGQQKKNIDVTPKPVHPSISRYSIAPRTKSTPLSELIRKVNSQPNSPFPAVSSLAGGGAAASPKTPSGLYSPYHKFSRRALSRIAPLHPNRRTPPPPLPPPPPKPKTKKEKEREERWEEEMIEDAGGWDEWKNLSVEQQKVIKRQKWERELGGWED